MKNLGAGAMKRLGIGAILLAMLAGPTFAQQPSMDSKDPAIAEREQQKKDREEVDKRYKATMEKTRQETTTTRTDPWSNMRGADDSKTKR
jgi:Ni/Co efflux regulator RcnB